MAISYPQALDFVQRFAQAVATDKEYLTELDAAIGDGDHGINMDRGMRAVMPKVEALPAGDVASLFRTVAMTLISTVGGASGPLYGTVFLQFATALKDKPEVLPADWAAAVASGVAGVQSRGKAMPDDKTMVDALLPASRALSDQLAAGASFDAALEAAEAAAEAGMKATIPLVARRGRASYLGERSAGHQDPGATSSWLLMKAAREAFAEGS
ncbi:MAG TPA: dihydroxyacetone kinase subunit DhaL [Candidatus Nanopelagicaceae bacterium]|nr:dihydroxyacetone kinase subunit DhaL [Candidatus Nanopelagicaceae bacterium]